MTVVRDRETAGAATTILRAARVSIVVPCRDEAGSIGRLLDALVAQDWPIEQAIIVDDRSTDDIAGIVGAFRMAHPGLDVRVVPSGAGGIAAALNRGIAEARGDVIIRFDAHSVPAPDYVRCALDALLSTDAGVVGGTWRIAAGGSGAVARAIAVAGAHPMGAGDAAYRSACSAAGRRAVDTVPFGCFRKDLWEQIGRFNERLLSNEDYEFNYRTRTRGRIVVLDPLIQSTYYARRTLVDLARQYARYGWWKAEMLKRFPQSLRWRQAVPPAFVTTLLTLAAASSFLAPARLILLLLVVIYACALVAASVHAAWARRDWFILPVLPLAFAVMHVAWGGAALVNVLTGGGWPRRWARFSATHDHDR